MAVVKQGGFTPKSGVQTTMGMRAIRAPVCWTCRERRDGQIYGLDTHGNPRCDDCTQKVLTRNDCGDSK